MPISQHFKLPTRVSRLYPLLTLVLMISSATAVYAWQNSALSSDAAIRDREVTISNLRSQVKTLTANAEKDQVTLKTQQAQIASDTTKLADLEKKVNDTTKALSDAQTQLDKQKSQLAANSDELEQLRNRPPLFSFQNKSSLTNVDAKEAAIKSLVTSAYDYIQALYGRPYLLNSITITFVDQFTIAGASGEIEINNSDKGISIDIHIKDFDATSFQDVNTIIHEMIHGFHGVAVLQDSALEEGMTVAMADAVMQNMITDGKLSSFGHLYVSITPATYTNYNKTLLVKADGNAFYSYSRVADVYQMIGYAWYKLYQQDPKFFLNFNNAYYPKVQAGKTVDAAGIRDIIANIIPSAGGTSIAQYLSQNRAFNPS